jgi:hypothetical protein
MTGLDWTEWMPLAFLESLVISSRKRGSDGIRYTCCHLLFVYSTCREYLERVQNEGIAQADTTVGLSVVAVRSCRPASCEGCVWKIIWYCSMVACFRLNNDGPPNSNIKTISTKRVDLDSVVL